jgi:hypothetical protein
VPRWLCPGLVAAAMLSALPCAAAGEVVARFDGDGDAVTPAFTVDSGFDVRWRTERAADFRILLKGFYGGIPSIVADPAMWSGLGRARSGSTSYLRAGRYSFEVRASGPWTIEVVADNDAATWSGTSPPK